MYVVLAVSCHARLSAPNELSAMAAAAARTACATARVASEVSVSFDRAGVASISFLTWCVTHMPMIGCCLLGYLCPGRHTHSWCSWLSMK